MRCRFYQGAPLVCSNSSFGESFSRSLIESQQSISLNLDGRIERLSIRAPAYGKTSLAR